MLTSNSLTDIACLANFQAFPAADSPASCGGQSTPTGANEALSLFCENVLHSIFADFNCCREHMYPGKCAYQFQATDFENGIPLAGARTRPSFASDATDLPVQDYIDRGNPYATLPDAGHAQKVKKRYRLDSRNEPRSADCFSSIDAKALGGTAPDGVNCHPKLCLSFPVKPMDGADEHSQTETHACRSTGVSGDVRLKKEQA